MQNLLTSREAADYLNISLVPTLYRWVAAKKIPVHRLPTGGLQPLRFRKEELDAWIAGEIVVCRSCGEVIDSGSKCGKCDHAIGVLANEQDTQEHNVG